jgi:hypothetical protein
VEVEVLHSTPPRTGAGSFVEGMVAGSFVEGMLAGSSVEGMVAGSFVGEGGWELCG